MVKTFYQIFKTYRSKPLDRVIIKFETKKKRKREKKPMPNSRIAINLFKENKSRTKCLNAVFRLIIESATLPTQFNITENFYFYFWKKTLYAMLIKLKPNNTHHGLNEFFIRTKNHFSTSSPRPPITPFFRRKAPSLSLFPWKFLFFC